MRPGLLLACSASLVALATPALAESHAPALVRLLHTPGRAHPLADAGGRIPLSVVLPAGADAAALGLLQVAPGIGALRLAPEEVGPFAAAHPHLALGVTPRLRPLLDVSGVWTHVAAFRQATGGLTGKGVIVGVVDTGLDVRHPDFRTQDGHTRVAWMLTAGAPAGKQPDLEDRFGCTDPKQSPCAVYSAADIDAIVLAGSDGLTDTDGHGTHVTSIAAGNGGASLTSPPRYVGMAPEATLVVAALSLQGQSPSDQSAGFTDTDILNGTRFVFDRAEAMGLPAVVNLSIGGDYGPHDGTSALEKGLSAFVGDQLPGRAVVVAAGNSGAVGTAADTVVPQCTGDGWICGTHTEVHVSPGEVARVPIVAAAAKNGQGFVWITFRPGDDVSVGFQGPGGSTWAGLTGKGGQGGGAQAVVVNDLPSAGATIPPDSNSAVVQFNGAWGDGAELAVVLQGSGDALLWISGQADSVDGLFFERAVAQGTINVPASAPALLAVGCTVNRIKWTPLGGAPVEIPAFGADMAPVADSACFFSAAGPNAAGVQKPEISAPGAFVAAAMSAGADPRKADPNAPPGLFALQGCPQEEPYCAVVDDHHALATGTSMSAPHVAGAVALLMELDLALQRGACDKTLDTVAAQRCPVTPTLTQARITEVLQAGARRSGGHVPDPDQLGPGSLDLDGARRALLDRATAPVDASPGKSWYTLSSAFARPDLSFPVWGTVELRKGDGTVAAGIDGGKLAVSLLNGTVIQPVTRVQPGLWRFGIAGRPADLGETITLDVLYDGVSLGARTLPVGFDVWSASDPTVVAVSGACAFPGAGARHGAGGLAFAAIAVAAGAARWRRRRDR